MRCIPRVRFECCTWMRAVFLLCSAVPGSWVRRKKKKKILYSVHSSLRVQYSQCWIQLVLVPPKVTQEAAVACTGCGSSIPRSRIAISTYGGILSVAVSFCFFRGVKMPMNPACFCLYLLLFTAHHRLPQLVYLQYLVERLRMRCVHAHLALSCVCLDARS